MLIANRIQPARAWKMSEGDTAFACPKCNEWLEVPQGFSECECPACRSLLRISITSAPPSVGAAQETEEE